MFVPFQPGQSALHRLSPGAKVVGLALAGTSLFLVQSPLVMALAAAAALALYPLAGLKVSHALDQLRPVALLAALIIAVQAIFDGPASALLVGARLIALLLLAGLVTLTTRTTAMIETLERALRPLAPLGLNPRKGALALSLGVRFVPLVAQVATEVREAQKTRGLEHNILALAVPTLIRALKLTDEIADAIEARGFDPDGTPET